MVRLPEVVQPEDHARRHFDQRIAETLRQQLAEFATGKGMADPAAETIAVQCGGKAPKDVQIIATEAAPWLTVAGDPQGECLRLTNRIKTAGLGVGNYDVDVILSSPAANPPKARYQVHLEVKQTHDATMPPATAPGLSYEYYEADQFYRLPDFSKLKASRRGVCPLPKGTCRIDNSTSLGDFRAILWRRPMALTRFSPLTTARRRLAVDAEQLIACDSGYPFREEKSTIWLRQGPHPIVVEYGQDQGGSAMDLSVALPGQPKRKVMAGDFVHATERR